MSRQTVSAALVAFLVAFGGGVLLNNRATPNSETSTTFAPVAMATTTLAPSFLQPGETVIGPAALIADDLRMDGSEVVLDFELHSLAPVADAASITRFLGFQSTEQVPPTKLDTVYPDDWLLVSNSAEIEGTSANPTARTARFDVGDGFSLATVEEIRLASYALLIPIDKEFELTIGNDSAVVAPGVTVRLLAVTEQARTIVQVELLSERRFNNSAVGISGVGPGWRSAVREAEGRPRWNLTYDSATAPEVIRLRVTGSIWVTIDTETTVLIGAGS